MKAPRQSVTNFNDIQDLIRSYYPDADLDLVRESYVYSARVHKDQQHPGNEPYLEHPLAVAGILAQLRLDEASVASGLLHDSVEDALTTVDCIEHVFGKEIATLVEDITKISKISFLLKDERLAENHRKMILAMCSDIRALIIKLADCLDTLRTPHLAPKKAQLRIARETRDIYAPLAGWLGLEWMRTELEDLAFKHLDPDSYTYIKARLEESIKYQERYGNIVVEIVSTVVLVNWLFAFQENKLDPTKNHFEPYC